MYSSGCYATALLVFLKKDRRIVNLITIYLHFPEISLQQEEAAVSLIRAEGDEKSNLIGTSLEGKTKDIHREEKLLNY
uniref:Uncharacterized protein n=1 Tax=Magallana gigas TaxID=29159 RepID=K1R1Q3_MAGGI